jgi:hypothetical protein
MCFSTARVPMPRLAAIAALLIPLAIASRISFSLNVSHASGERPRPRAITSRWTTFGSITEPPSATALITPAS